MDRYLLWRSLFLLALFSIGLYKVVTSVRSMRKAVVSRSWPSTSGRVLSADVIQRHRSGSGRSYQAALFRQ